MSEAVRPGEPAAVAARQAAAVIAGHREDAASARQLLADTEGAVRVAALGALHRCRELTETELANALTDPAPLVRRRAAELAAAYPAVDLGATLADPDATVVEMAAWAVGERPIEADTTARLIGLASGPAAHNDALCREAAVAAIGALGSADGLETILAALEDKPAVRRRAVLALANYEGPLATAALRRAATDRDWQVRQAAEDLLRALDIDLQVDAAADEGSERDAVGRRTVAEAGHVGDDATLR